MDEEALRAMLPMGFGRQRAGGGAPAKAAAHAGGGGADAGAGVPVDGAASDAAARLSAAPPQGRGAGHGADSVGGHPACAEVHAEQGHAARGDAPSDDTRGDAPALAGAPLAQRVSMRDHTKTVCALAVDPSGARVATGSMDYEVRLWDFGGMSSDFRPFRRWEPAENYPVVDLAYSPHTRDLLCITATTQPRVYDFDGAPLATYRKGDVYMRDMKHTTGHVSDMTCGAWHPTERNRFLTGGTDSTVRVWDTEHTDRQKTVIVVRSRNRGTKTKVTAATYAPDGSAVLAGGADGALYVWSTRGTYARPSATVERAHAPEAGISGITPADDGRTVATRGGDGTVKLWDLRAMRTPLVERAGLPSGSEHTNVAFSPDGQFLVTGTAAEPHGSDAGDDPESQWGQIVLMDRADLAVRRMHPVDRATVVRTAWHPRLNQIFASTRTGAVELFYDEHASQLGALLAVGKRARARAHMNPFGIEEIAEGVTADTPIILPDEPAPPTKRRNIDKLRKDAKATRMPERPIAGPGRGGRIGAAETQSMVRGIWQDQLRDEDPREALLKYAEKAKKDPKWTSIYAKTQPNPVYAKPEERE
ncbi:hypothetical protein MSPP1_000684 [Malassezia sp. CBS 17886]|nr:hypothetical protein MSPP1_000684 [Malassezia sp. CBS 17886]